jgi:hypothetical protein
LVLVLLLLHALMTSTAVTAETKSHFTPPILQAYLRRVITRTVYSLYYPETRAIVDALWAERHHEWYERAYEKRQDAMHGEFLETWRAWSGLAFGDAFPHAYPTSGASEPIKDLLVPPGRLHVFAGEYEGYGAIARERGMEVVVHPRALDAARAAFEARDQFWISNPSAIDGCAWPELDAFIDAMRAHAPAVRVFLDATYVGATKTRVAMEPARHANVAAVVFSLSKPMGVYYHRIGGCVSRAPIGTLWGNLWFKNLFSLKLGTALMQKYGVTELPSKYAHVQERVLAAAKKNGIAPDDARASDVVLLAHSKVPGTRGAEHERAPNAYRFCLTPGMDEIVNGKGSIDA